MNEFLVVQNKVIEEISEKSNEGLLTALLVGIDLALFVVHIERNQKLTKFSSESLMISLHNQLKNLFVEFESFGISIQRLLLFLILEQALAFLVFYKGGVIDLLEGDGENVERDFRALLE